MDYSNYNVNKNEFFCSWPIILLALYIFFPVGIYLIIKKSKLHRRNVFTIGKKTFTVGMSLLIFGIIFYIPKMILFFIDAFNFSRYSDLEMVVNSQVYSSALEYGNFFIGLSIVVLFISLCQRNKSKRYQNYIYLIVNKEIENLDEISSKMKVSKNTVIKNINKMIDRRFLENFQLSIHENRIYNVSKKKAEEMKKSEYTRIVRCPNCHANNLIDDKIGKCEYCKSYIE